MSLTYHPLVPNGNDVDCEPHVVEEMSFRKKWIDKHSVNGSANGDCFIKNYHEFQRQSQTNPHLHYAIIQMRYRKSGNQIIHAIVLDGDIIHDVAQGVIVRCDRYTHSEFICHPYDINKYVYWNKDNIPSLETIMDGWSSYQSWGMTQMKNGDLPRLKGKWENAVSTVI